MPVSRLRLVPLVAILVALAALPPGPARAARTAVEAQRIAEFARRYKQLQQHLLLEREEQGFEWGGERLGPAPGASELEGMIGNRAPARSAGPALPLGGGGPPLATNVRANDPTLDAPSATQSEVSVAANGDNVLLAFNDGQGVTAFPRTHTQGYAWSTNGGQSFTDGGAPPSPPGWLWDSDPVVAVNEKTGEFWYLGLNSSSTLNGIALVKATFSGGAIAWGTPHLVRSADDFEVLLDKPWMTVDPASGRLHVVYTAFGAFSPTDTIEIQSSSDGGLTWSAPLALSDPADDGYVQGARVAVGPASEVYATWYVIGRDAPYTDAFPLRKSTNGGASFTPARTAASVFSNFSSGAPGFNRPRGITFPTLAVDRSNGPHRGRVYLGWQECVNFYDDLLGTLPGLTETESNDTPALAQAFTIGDSLRGTLGPGDLDFFKFNATQGQTVVCFGYNWGATLDMSMRLLCGDGTTMLALSSSGPSQSDLIVFSIPVPGTYYVRMKGLSGSGTYTVYTGLHVPLPGERARDHRDVFVTSSDDGVVWRTPARVNDDDPWLDDWLPEIAVSNLSRLYASWYDWRDAPGAICNAASQVYLASSDDGGATWATLGALSDAASDWTDWSSPPTKSNLAPNQGDYNALFADCQAVYGAWSDARDADVNIYTGRYPPLSQPTLVTFASATALPRQVTLAWQAQGGLSLTGTVERRDLGGAWSPLVGSSTTDGSGRMPYVDATVSPGHSYEYRLVVPQPPAGDWITCGVQVDVPVEVMRLTLGRARPNPTSTDIIVTFDLPTNAPATLQLLDLSGRRVASREVGSFGPGRPTLNLGAGLNLRSGIYFVRLAQSGQEATTRISVVR
jgi:hypothetical protein